MEAFLLEHVPAPLLALGIVAIAVAVAVGAVALVRRRVPLETLDRHRDVASYIYAMVGVVYAVLLAFVVVVVWEQFEEAKRDTTREAATVEVIYRDAVVFGAAGTRARTAVERYARSVVDSEWPEMADHQRESRETDDAAREMWAAFAALEPRTAAHVALFDEAVGHLHEASELRRTRVIASSARLPASLWVVLIAGAVICVGFTCFFGVHLFRTQVLMVGSLATIIGLVLFLILTLDQPFTGDTAVAPTEMEDVIEEFAHLRG